MTKNMTLYVAVGAAVVLMLGSGYVQGLWSERWGTFPELAIFSEQLAAVPKEIGEWKGTDAEATDEKILKIAGATGELVRTYTNGNGDQVLISIICGRLRDITYHTPDRCYPAAGFDMQNEPMREVVTLPDGSEAVFFAANFTKSEPTGTHTERGFWSWTGDGQWTAPDNTKFAFASQQRALYKLYVFAVLPREEKPAGAREYYKDFMQVFLPALNNALQPAFERVGRIESDADTPDADQGETIASPEEATAPAA